MAQQIINIGQLPNDGTGTPLRTAFAETNNNFTQIFAAGPVGSNLVIQNNSILSTNTNGEIRLVPNGVGTVVANSHVIPNATNIRNLGSTGRRWRSVYTQYTDTVYQNVWGNLSVGGNLIVTGNTVTTNIANLTVDDLTITLANGATTSSMANGAGIIINGANYAVQYAAATDTLNFSAGIGVDGTVQALSFKGDGGGLVNVSVQVNASELVGDTLASGIVNSSLTTVGTLANLLVAGNVQISGSFTGNASGLVGIPGSSIVGAASNAAYANLAAVALTANTAAQSVFASTSNYALAAGKAGYANTAGTAVQSDNANVALHACRADTANVAILASNSLYSNTSLTAVTVTGSNQPNITTVGSLANLTVAGNIVTAGILTNNYYYANGQPFAGGNGSAANYGNSNVAAFLADYSGPMGALQVTGISTDNYLYGNGQPVVFDNYSDANVVSLLANGVPFINSANVLTESLTVTGYSSLTTVGVTGNAVIGNIFSDHYFYANGVPINFGGGGFVVYEQDITPAGNVATFTLDHAATTEDVVVSINGVVQLPAVAYAVTANTNITFAGVPATSDQIGIRFLGTASIDGLVIGSQQITPNGTTTAFALSTPATNTTVIVAVNGLVQTPGADFNIVGTNIVFTSAPSSTSRVDIRFLSEGAAGAQEFAPDGVSTSYILNYPASNTSVLVSINGLVQNPGSAYNVVGQNIIFTSVPAVSDYVNILFLSAPATNSYGNVDVAAFLPTYTGNLGGVLTTASQPNITSVGTLGNLTVSGNVTTNTLIANNIVSTSIINKASSQVARGVGVTLNNLTAVVAAAGNYSIQVNTVDGSTLNLVGSEQSVLSGTSGSTGIAIAVGAGATYINSLLDLTTGGDLQITHLIDTTVGVGYRVTLVRGTSTLSQIVIEQLY